MKKIFLLLTICLSAAVSFAQPPSLTISAEDRPFVRWWWFGSAVDEKNLTWNLEKFAEAGLGGVEITPIYGVQNNEGNDVAYLSPRWMELYAHTMKEAERLGLQVDMNNGTGWPFGGPQITTVYSAKKFFVKTFTAEADEILSISLALDKKRLTETATVQCAVAVSGKNRHCITHCIKGKSLSPSGHYLAEDAVLEWVAEEDSKIYILYSCPTFQKVKRAAPGGEGLVMDHYNKNALEHYLTRFDNAFQASGVPWPAVFFNDSFEVYGADWSEDLPEMFHTMHGYRIESMLPELMGEGDADTCARVVTDYRETLARLLEENFTVPWTEWAHSHGVRTRNQAHGSPANIIDLYADVDIPECESFGRSDFNIPGLRRDTIRKPNDGDPAVLKFASSAAHLAGKRKTSAEALTWLTEHFRTSLSQCKPEIDRMLVSGVNHVVFHGAPYSPEGVSFPGWKFYAAIDMSPTNNIWKHAPAFFEYTARCQAFLSEGMPDNEILLYLPLYDIWHERQAGQLLLFDIHNMDTTMPEVKKAMDTILSEGYDADYVSDRFIRELSVRDSLLYTESGTEYKALIIPACKRMPVSTLEKITDLAREGANIIFIGHLPEDVPGFSRLEERRGRMKELVDGLKGKILTGSCYTSLLRQAGATYEPFKSEMSGSMIRRKNNDGGYDYFLAMLDDRPVHGYVPLGANLPEDWDGTVWICDPLTGEWMKGLHKSNTKGLSVRMNLDPGEALLLRIVPQKDTSDMYGVKTLPYKTGKETVIDRGWSLSFPESNPELRDTFNIDTLVQWCAINDCRLSVNCGTGLYRTVFRTPESDADGWFLDLGDVRESARVRLNGLDAGTLFCVPFRIYLDKEMLAPAGQENVLEIEVCNLPSNRIADFERRGIPWRIFKDANIASVTGKKNFSFGEWPVDPSGLNSEVRLIEVEFFSSDPAKDNKQSLEYK